MPDADDAIAAANPSAPVQDEERTLLVLQDLATRIIPQNLRDDLRELVDAGVINPLMTCPSQPLLSPVTQMFRTDKPVDWLKILFSRAPEKVVEAKCPCTGFTNGRFSTEQNLNDYYGYNKTIETPSLVSVLVSRTETPVVDLASLCPAALSFVAPDRYGNYGEMPLLHQMLQTKEFSVATLDKLEQATGGDAFLMLKNARGETLFHRIASAVNQGEDQARLDVASWMLQRRPDLVNEPDRFGWTPLDRLLSLSQGKYDTSMGRLLVVSGAHLEKQLAPQFNLQAALDAHPDARLGKLPPPRKAAVLTKGL